MRFALGLILAATLSAAGTPLFNGRDLTGWVNEGPRATFGAAGGELVASGRGFQPNWLHTEREYENFRLHLEYKLAQWAEAAVILRAPRLGRPVQSGVAIYLAHDYHENASLYRTGAIPGVLPPRQAQKVSWGDWHSVDVELAGDRLQASIDGSLVQDVELGDHPELRYRLKRGFIGFPDQGYAYSLRNILIEDLASDRKFVDLFDGRTLTGWTLRGGGVWSVKDGSLAGANGHGVLYAGPKFSDFELTALVRTHNRVNSGIFLRGSPDGQKSRGFEVQIFNSNDSVYPTGSVYGYDRANLSADYDGEWFLIQILVKGSECRVRLNGETVSHFEHLPPEVLGSGQIGLQIHMEDASVQFRDIRVRPL
jgi:hypothetical protein